MTRKKETGKDTTETPCSWIHKINIVKMAISNSDEGLLRIEIYYCRNILKCIHIQPKSLPGEKRQEHAQDQG